VINAGWISISAPVEFFQNPVQTGSGSELQIPVGSRSGILIMFNTGTHAQSSLMFYISNTLRKLMIRALGFVLRCVGLEFGLGCEKENKLR